MLCSKGLNQEVGKQEFETRSSHKSKCVTSTLKPTFSRLSISGIFTLVTEFHLKMSGQDQGIVRNRYDLRGFTRKEK